MTFVSAEPLRDLVTEDKPRYLSRYLKSRPRNGMGAQDIVGMDDRVPGGIISRSIGGKDVLADELVSLFHETEGFELAHIADPACTRSTVSCVRR